MDEGAAAGQDGKVLQGAGPLLLDRAGRAYGDGLESVGVLVGQQEVDGARRYLLGDDEQGGDLGADGQLEGGIELARFLDLQVADQDGGILKFDPGLAVVGVHLPGKQAAFPVHAFHVFAFHLPGLALADLQPAPFTDDVKDLAHVPGQRRVVGKGFGYLRQLFTGPGPVR